MPEFIPMPKIPRLMREMVITEKLDGTNASILIRELTLDQLIEENDPHNIVLHATKDSPSYAISAGSRNRWLTAHKHGDNYGFAKWVQYNASELVKLGPGHHFGEWWGQGIQHGYGLKEKRFSLFNVNRWTQENIPSCCHVVPHLYTGPFEMEVIHHLLRKLEEDGSVAVPGWMEPEGLIIYHTAAKQLFKYTLKNDAEGKGQ